MTARTGAYVVLLFAAVWLWLGAHVLPAPWNGIVGAVGVAILLLVGWRARDRRTWAGGTRRFDRRIFALAVAFEVVAANIVAWVLGRHAALDYIWPALGIVVALHFIGLYWASGDRRFVTLTVTMLAVNVAALVFPAGSVAMLAVTGLGSFAALVWAAARR